MDLQQDSQLNKIGQIASHNTYAQDSDWSTQLDYVNAVELDVWPLHNWIVSHAFDIGAGHLIGYMNDLKNWRERNQNHDLLTVFIEIKSKEGWKVTDFESILCEHLNTEDMFTPNHLLEWAGNNPERNYSTLKELVQQKGWPQLKHVKNKVMFVLNSGSSHVVDTYLDERQVFNDNPLCFVMSSEDDSRNGSENIVIFNGEYDSFEKTSTPPRDNCLRRAYQVNVGNDEMNEGNKKPATRLMKDKQINYLAYDNVEGAFSITLE